MSVGIKNFLLIILALFVCSCAGAGSYIFPTTTVGADELDSFLSVIKKDYKVNEVSVKDRYEGTTLVATGKMTRVVSNGSMSYISLNHDLLCIYDSPVSSTQLKKLAAVSEGDEVTVSGYFMIDDTSITGKKVKIFHCNIK